MPLGRTRRLEIRQDRWRKGTASVQQRRATRVFLVQRRMALMGDGIGHVAFDGDPAPSQPFNFRDRGLGAVDQNHGTDAASAFLVPYGPEAHDLDRLAWWTLVDDLW